MGTGMVGNTIASKLVGLGHEVMMGSRTSDNPKAAAWVASAGANASQGTFEDAAKFGEVVFNCTSGMGSLAALEQAGAENLSGKIIVDLANALDFSKGFPPTLAVCNTDSLAEQIQRAFPDARVVKTLNTVNCLVMVNPALIPGDHTIFVSGNDSDAKETVCGYLSEWFGWPARNIMDLGDITSARAVEMMLPLWLQVFGAMQNPNVNVHVVAGAKPGA
jgi:predicted dinucleotide-binding enzyme